MKLEILLSCMYQKNFDIVKKFNVHSDILIVNQCDENGYQEEIINGYLCRMINTTKRGLSQSRNELLNNMNGDIGIFCDDDVIYYDNYDEIILKAYNKLEKADVIVFDMDFILDDNFKNKIFEETKNIKTENKNIRIRKSPRHKNYISSTISFRKKSLQDKNIWFNLNFGTGSKKYSNGEESLVMRESKRKGLKVYEYLAIIGI